MDNKTLKRILQKEFSGLKLVDDSHPQRSGTLRPKDLKKRLLQLFSYHVVVQVGVNGFIIRDLTKEEYLKETASYYHGGFSMIPKNTPDGAWMQMHLDIAENLLSECQLSINYKTPHDVDKHTIVEYYLENR